jgi:hypothetical protein
MSKMGDYVLSIQEAVFEATAMRLTEAGVVAFVKARVPLASTNDILAEYQRISSNFMDGI